MDGWVDLLSGVVERANQRDRLTTMELAVLRHLVARAPEPVDRTELLEEVWQVRPTLRTRAPDATIRRLRTKVERDPSAPRHVCTVHGSGYRFVAVSTVPHPLRRPVRWSGEDLVGRDEALAWLRDALDRHRWITVTGPPGVGKTVLVQHALAGEAALVVIVETATAAGIAAAVGQALDLPTAGAHELAVALDDRRLVLDPLDHPAPDVLPLLEGWLGTAPGLSIVGVGRSTLHDPREHVLRLKPLGLVDGAVLFRRRATAFGGHPSSDDDIDALVARLDGLPLAIELAAARTPVLSAKRLVEALADGHTVLGGAARRSLDDTLVRSWDALDRAGQTMLAQLSVFEGGFDLSAIGAVVTLDAGRRALDVLQDLVLHSLVGPSDPDRFTLLGPLRAFAAARLAAMPERLAAAHARHGRYYAHGHGSSLDDANVLAASERALQRGDAPLAARAYLVLSDHRGALPEPRASALSKAFAGVSGLDPTTRARVTVARARHAHVQARWPEAVELCTEAARQLGEVGLVEEQAVAMVGVGLGLVRLGQLEAARRWGESGMALVERGVTPERRLDALDDWSTLVYLLGDPQGARAILIEAEQLARAIGVDGARRAEILAHLAAAAGDVGELREAVRWAEEALLADPSSLTAILVTKRLGSSHLGLGETGLARRWLQEAYDLAVQHGVDRLRLEILAYQGQVARAEGDPAASVDFLERALQGFEQQDRSGLKRGILASYALGLVEIGEPARAVGPLREALAPGMDRVYEMLRAPLWMAQLAHASALLGDDDSARALLVDARAAAGDEMRRPIRVGMARFEAETELLLGRPDVALARAEEALSMLQTDDVRIASLLDDVRDRSLARLRESR
ncbi:MAG: winged helix-turn-helix domain-containing protein [Myxococcota bacterium]